jgi:hypothetical protein
VIAVFFLQAKQLVFEKQTTCPANGIWMFSVRFQTRAIQKCPGVILVPQEVGTMLLCLRILIFLVYCYGQHCGIVYGIWDIKKMCWLGQCCIFLMLWILTLSVYIFRKICLLLCGDGECSLYPLERLMS